MDIPKKIKSTRKMLKETQTEFGKRFGVNANAVSRWESGVNEAPYRVLQFADNVQWRVCERCGGKGYIINK